MIRKILRCLLLLAVCFFSFSACAEIRCECGLECCICFIQVGDEGIAVNGIAGLLAERAYLSTSRKNTFDQQMQEAVLGFQRDHGLTQSGLLDDNTLSLLIWGLDSDELDQSMPNSNGNAVWVPTDGGKKRHKNQLCSRMLDPRMMSVRNAEALGIDACKRCNPD